ncbi:4Fe-4S ferredoxin [Nodosilinea sp. LEGE 06152]|uniref:circadian clock protein LdpA n=1 Tax=Nodosilinea sp. LEGE 06152 TaxID=2777966 RepID=UPI0018814049|nr:LdpA C-terminal domain-containing domain [Nodosilinea sp. LEGE 06152]MBE9158810.1 4Fe-4S ferredoxin [Nodosilinea sp. LEGE 06152]
MDTETAPGTAAGSYTAENPSPSPYQSLQAGSWVKLICGASYQDMPTIRRLAMLYALAGADCIDVAADGAVVAAARQGLEDAVWLTERLGDRKASALANRGLPWLMVSLNDSEDPHFRKAHFDAAHCPPDCDRPCEPVCPTAAIQFRSASQGGVKPDLCYGCGRCIAVCPLDRIEAQSYMARPEAFSSEQLVQIDAVEIHTQTGHQAQFEQLWQRLQPWRPHLKLISISCPDHDRVVPYLQDLYNLMAPLAVPLIWQTDGRPMSGDLGKGTTHAAIRLAQKILQAGLPGHVQPAGGTNGYTVDKLLALGLIKNTPSASYPDFPPSGLASSQSGGMASHGSVLVRNTISGIAYGGYGRSQVLPLLDAIDYELQPWLGNASLNQPSNGQWGSPTSDTAPVAPWQRLDNSALGQGLALAQQLVNQLKIDRHFLPTRYG